MNEMDGVDGLTNEERRREELDTLVEQSSSYLVRCYECPVINPCSYGDEVLALRAEIEVKLPVADYRLSEVIDTLEAMKKIGRSCPLLNGCDHHFKKRDR